MNSEKQRQKDLNLNAMVEDLLSRNEPDLDIDERLLWAYALNALELPHREQVLQLVARSESAQETLERIEQSIATAAETRELPVVARARQHAMDTLAEMGRDLSSVAAVITRLGDGLVSVFDRLSEAPQGLAAQGLMLGDTATESREDAAATKAAGRRRIDVGEENGLRASVILTSGDLLDLQVVTPPELNSQMVKLFELVPNGRGGEQAIQIALSRVQPGEDDQGKDCGIVSFTDCPMEIYRIVAPDGSELAIWCV
ncbi:MAG: hypothetical protein ACQESR_02305 [Planctomycetota bacterium]